MRISDWSSDVCSSDLTVRLQPVAYSASGLPEAKSFLDWKNFASAPYTSQTQGDRFVVNHANDIAEEPYGRYEKIGTMPPGGLRSEEVSVGTECVCKGRVRVSRDHKKKKKKHNK